MVKDVINTDSVRVKGWKKIIQVNINQKKVCLYSYKIVAFRAKTITRNDKGCFKLIASLRFSSSFLCLPFLNILSLLFPISSQKRKK